MRRRRLTRTEERQYLAHATILQQEGISLEIPKEWKEHAYPLEISVAPPPVSEVFERSRGGLSYSVYLRLLSKARCMIEQVAITVAWDDRIILESLDQRYPVGVYGYPPVSWKEVLNSRIEGGLKFARSGEVVEGFLLARGGARFPEQYRTGQSVPFTLSLYDQYRVEMQEHGYLYVQRAEGKGQESPRTG